MLLILEASDIYTKQLWTCYASGNVEPKGKFSLLESSGSFVCLTTISIPSAGGDYSEDSVSVDLDDHAVAPQMTN